MPQDLRIPIITKPSIVPQQFVDIPPGYVRAFLKACNASLGRVVPSDANCLVTCKDGFLLFLTVHDERNRQLTVSLPLPLPPSVSTEFSQYLQTLWKPEETPEEFNTMAECAIMLNGEQN